MKEKVLRGSSKHQRRRGQAILELAIVCTVLLLLTLGLVQYGLLANANVTLSNLAREGVRYAAVHATEANSDTAIKNHVVEMAAATPLRAITANDVTISPDPTSTDRASGKPVTVSVSYNMRRKFIFPLPANFPGLSNYGTRTTRSSIMVIE